MTPRNTVATTETNISRGKSSNISLFNKGIKADIACPDCTIDLYATPLLLVVLAATALDFLKQLPSDLELPEYPSTELPGMGCLRFPEYRGTTD